MRSDDDIRYGELMVADEAACLGGDGGRHTPRFLPQ